MRGCYWSFYNYYCPVLLLCLVEPYSKKSRIITCHRFGLWPWNAYSSKRYTLSFFFSPMCPVARSLWRNLWNFPWNSLKWTLLLSTTEWVDFSLGYSSVCISVFPPRLLRLSVATNFSFQHYPEIVSGGLMKRLTIMVLWRILKVLLILFADKCWTFTLSSKPLSKNSSYVNWFIVIWSTYVRLAHIFLNLVQIDTCSNRKSGILDKIYLHSGIELQ